MPSDPSLPRKSFLIERYGDKHREPFKASVESVENPHYADVIPEIAAIYDEAGESRHAVKLTMPDGSEWLIGDGTLEYVLGLVRESREYLAAQG